MIVEGRTRYSCPPTLSDDDVLAFCRDGYITFDGIVPAEVNERACAFTDELGCRIGEHLDEPSELLREPWFVDSVLLHPTVAGALRALLGDGYGLPIIVSNHRVTTPAPAQQWHHDGGSRFDPSTHYLQVFYLPQDTEEELGPLEILPGSHLRHAEVDRETREGDGTFHTGPLPGGKLLTGRAGTICITDYPLLHRRTESSAQGRVRNLIKYNYFRVSPPTRDWLTFPLWDMSAANFTPEEGDRQRASLEYGGERVARKFFWLCGLEEPKFLGGQAFPNPAKKVDSSYGFPGADEALAIVGADGAILRPALPVPDPPAASATNDEGQGSVGRLEQLVAELGAQVAALTQEVQALRQQPQTWPQRPAPPPAPPAAAAVGVDWEAVDRQRAQGADGGAAAPAGGVDWDLANRTPPPPPEDAWKQLEDGTWVPPANWKPKL